MKTAEACTAHFRRKKPMVIKGSPMKYKDDAW
jgi:hypothetical protein